MIENKSPGKDVSSDDLLEKFPLAAKTYSKKKTVINVNGTVFGGKSIPLFCGPNMAESEDLMVDVARQLKLRKIDFLRAGAFKPLSFPYRSLKYTETREKGIQYLKTAKQETGINVITEVMESKNLELVCEVADILQIGARNMQNYPFLVDCAKTGKPIMLKRHFGASIRDLLGAAEYILNAGNPNLILCERGVVAPHTHRSSSRFLLDLQSVPALQELTHLPIAVDPSHACFWRPWVNSLACASVAAGADALMLEVHPTPELAAVDPLQAISYTELDAVLDNIRGIAGVLSRSIK
jgi:3-deoxy-7-phosphoheptulonate synthase